MPLAALGTALMSVSKSAGPGPVGRGRESGLGVEERKRQVAEPELGPALARLDVLRVVEHVEHLRKLGHGVVVVGGQSVQADTQHQGTAFLEAGRNRAGL